MVIILSNLKRPGLLYDSSKSAILLGKITNDINQRTKGNYIAKGKVSGNQLQITVVQLNPETRKYSPVQRNEQEILSGRISSFLNNNGISHNIKVT